jgi:hypothetical protein
MTRKNQTVRSWISRKKRSECWLSHVSHKGRVHSLRTPTMIRKAALEFNVLHTLNVLTAKANEAPSLIQTEIPLHLTGSA